MTCNDRTLNIYTKGKLLRHLSIQLDAILSPTFLTLGKLGMGAKAINVIVKVHFVESNCTF